MVMLKDNVEKTGDRVKKTGSSQKVFDNEMLVYKKRLSYTPKLISHDHEKRDFVISYECCVPLTKVPKREREFYYPQIKKLFYRLKKDTGFYHADFAPKNIIVNTKTKKVKLIDFGMLAKDFEEVSKVRRSRNEINNLLNDVGISRR